MKTNKGKSIMKYKSWSPDMTDKETAELAYFERNMLALYAARLGGILGLHCGWYNHFGYKGWERVISIADGYISFHVPDNFDLGDLNEIEPNWNGGTSEEKFQRLALLLGIKEKINE